MFDNPGGKLKLLEQELQKMEDDVCKEPLAAPVDDDVCMDEAFDENDALLAEEPRRPGLRTLVFLVIVAVIFAGAGWWLGWF